LKTLVDAVAAAALNPQFPEATLPVLQGSMQSFEQFSPGRVQALRQEVDEFTRSLNPGQNAWNHLAQEITPDEDRATILAQLSPMDLESRRRWAEYSRAKDEMFAVTDIKQAP
jgi:hypothetical protein